VGLLLHRKCELEIGNGESADPRKLSIIPFTAALKAATVMTTTNAVGRANEVIE
jgi:hypothetical protein